MSEKIIIPDPYKSILQAVDRVPYFWAEHPLADHPDLPQFNRKLVVSGFNCPDLEEQNDERIYITVKQILIHKDTGKVFKTFRAPLWEILADTWSYFRDTQDPSKLVQVDKHVIDDGDGSVISTEKTYIQLGTIKYLKFLLHQKKAHLVDLFEMYLKDFAAAKKEDLDKL